MIARTLASLLALAVMAPATLFAQELSPVQTVQVGQQVSGSTVSSGGPGINVNSQTESISQVRPADEPPPSVTNGSAGWAAFSAFSTSTVGVSTTTPANRCWRK